MLNKQHNILLKLYRVSQKSFRLLNLIIVFPDKNKGFDWFISGPSTAVLDCQKGVIGPRNRSPV